MTFSLSPPSTRRMEKLTRTTWDLQHGPEEGPVRLAYYRELSPQWGWGPYHGTLALERLSTCCSQWGGVRAVDDEIFNWGSPCVHCSAWRGDDEAVDLYPFRATREEEGRWHLDRLAKGERAQKSGKLEQLLLEWWEPDYAPLDLLMAASEVSDLLLTKSTHLLTGVVRQDTSLLESLRHPAAYWAYDYA